MRGGLSAVDEDMATVHGHPCPCCGGRMMIVELFEPGCQPQHRPLTPPRWTLHERCPCTPPRLSYSRRCYTELGHRGSSRTVIVLATKLFPLDNRDGRTSMSSSSLTPPALGPP